MLERALTKTTLGFESSERGPSYGLKIKHFIGRCKITAMTIVYVYMWCACAVMWWCVWCVCGVFVTCVVCVYLLCVVWVVYVVCVWYIWCVCGVCDVCVWCMCMESMVWYVWCVCVVCVSVWCVWPRSSPVSPNPPFPIFPVLGLVQWDSLLRQWQPLSSCVLIWPQSWPTLCRPTCAVWWAEATVRWWQVSYFCWSGSDAWYKTQGGALVTWWEVLIAHPTFPAVCLCCRGRYFMPKAALRVVISCPSE